MNKIERHQYILQSLQETGSILVNEVSEYLGCSTETIRRDFSELESKGLLNRIHGGAYSIDTFDKGVPITLRKSFFVEEKEKISSIAINFINKGDLIILDHSSTCLTLAKQIFEKDLEITIITNSLDIAILFNNSKRKTKITLLGGTLFPKAAAFLGNQTILALESIVAAKCFISSPGVSLNFGLTGNSEVSALVRKAMIQRSKETFLIIDHTKIENDSNIVITQLKDIDTLITDKEPKKRFKDALNNLNIKIYY